MQAMGKPHERSLIARELAKLLDRLPRGRHLSRSALRKLLGDHHGVPWVPPPKAAKPRRKRVRAAQEAALADPLDAPLPAAPPSPTSARERMKEALRVRAAQGAHDQFGMTIDVQWRRNRP
jgi:hypothetical protein